MVDFNTVLNDARQLSEEDQLRLIDALGQVNANETDAVWHETIKRRSAEARSGAVELIPWETIRDESLRQTAADYWHDRLNP